MIGCHWQWDFTKVPVDHVVYPWWNDCIFDNRSIEFDAFQLDREDHANGL